MPTRPRSARAASRIAARPSRSPISSIASSGIERVRVARIGVDRSAFPLRYAPGHPAADADGYVLMPNVNPLLEMMDLREAQRSFEANLNALTLARSMVQRTLDLLR